MANLFQSQERLPSTDLDPEDLQAIVDSIDDHLAFWNVVYNDSVRSQEDGLPVSLAPLSMISDWLKMSSAPLYPSQGAGGARGFIYRFLNLVVKVFGSPQIRFNQKLRDLLGELLLTFQMFNTQAVALKSTVADQGARIRALEAENYDFRQEFETLTRQAADLRADLDRFMHERGSEGRA